MTDLSFQRATLTFGDGRFAQYVLRDLSDSGTPIEFGRVEPIGTERDLNAKLAAFTRIVTPEFSISVIPGSQTDKTFRDWLLACAVVKKSIYSPSNVVIPSATLTFPDGDEIKFVEGYLVGGSASIGVQADGRMTDSPFRFVWASVQYGSPGFGISQFDETAIYVNGKPVDGIYYAHVNSNASARTIQHPIETGAPIFDQKYLEPERVSVKVKIPLSIYEQVVPQFFEMLADRTLSPTAANKTGYSIITKTEPYENLTLIRVTHDETPDSFDLIGYNLEFQELMFSTSEATAVPQESSDQNVANAGSKNPQSSRPTN